MPRKSVPAYCLHKATGQGYVKIDGKRKYLGVHGTPDSHRRYAEEIAKWQASQMEPVEGVTVKQLTLLFFKHCESHYRKSGNLTSEFYLMQLALRHLNRKFKDIPADDFNPMKLAIIRQGMIDSGNYCRKTINGYIKRIVQCFKWGVSKGLVKVTTYQALTTLDGLQAGRCEVRESEPVKPVELADVEAIRDYISGPLWGVVQFQLATAARPGEALQLRLGDIDRGGAVWIYRPGSPKTAHHGKNRLILLGPKAQAIIQEHLQSTAPEAFIFGVPGSGGAKHYRRDSYTNAVKRACEIAFNMPKELRKLKIDSPAELKAKAEEWRREHCWHPNQLRHTAATEIRKAAGSVEVSKTILGHSELRTTELYAERELARAAEIIQKIG